MKIITEHLILDNRVVRKACIVDGKHNHCYYIFMPWGYEQITHDRFNEMESNLARIANRVVENKTTVVDWFDNLEIPISTRLLKTLLEMNKEEKWQYIEDINAADVRRVRGAGMHTYNEFKALLENGNISTVL